MTRSLESLLAEFWERREAGERLQVDAFVAAHPEHTAALRAALSRMLQAAALLPGEDLPSNIAGYPVEQRLGRGATGEVFAVVDAAGRRRALKRLLPHVAAVERARQRLLREGRVLRGLRHPGIVAVVDVGEDTAAGGVPFLVMELVDGAPLTNWLEAARNTGIEAASARLAGPGSPWQRIARLGAAIAEAVATAHTAGVLHRDLKPGNVLLRGDGTPVVVDFGLAADDAAATLTGTGDVIGTPHYMAPEQARGEAATPATDVHAIGAILYETITLRLPRDGSDVMQVLDAARRSGPRPPRTVCAEVPRELDLIVRRAMAFRTRHRHASAGELAAALRLVAAGGRPVGLTLGVGIRLDEFWRHRRRPLVAGAGAAALAAAALVGSAALADGSAERARLTRIAALEAHFDDDRTALAATTGVLARAGEVRLAHFLRGDTATASEDAFLGSLAAARQMLSSNPRSAMQACERALTLQPDSSLAAGWLGIAAAQAKADDVAERELVSAVRSLPASVRLREELARVLRKQPSRRAEAIAQMQHAVTLPRADAGTWHELAKALHTAHRYEEALPAVDRALAGLRGSARSRALRTKATLITAVHRHEEALPLFRELLDVAPNPDTWTSYGAVLDCLHRLREAAAAYREALALAPGHAPALLNLTYLHTGSDREGCAECRLAFSADPDLLDPGSAEDYAVGLLEAQEGTFELAETAAGYLRRVDAGARFLAAVEDRLARDLPAEALGRLVRARQVLRPK